MGIFHSTLAYQLEKLSKGKIIEIETTTNNVLKNSQEYQKAPKMKFTFWMDKETGELNCKYISFIEETPDKYDEKEDVIHKGQYALALLFRYSYLKLGTYHQKVYDNPENINSNSMTLGLLYLIEIMNFIDSKLAELPECRHHYDVFVQLFNNQCISFSDFSKEHSNDNLDKEKTIESLHNIASDNHNLLYFKLGYKHIAATDEELFPKATDVKYKSKQKV